METFKQFLTEELIRDQINKHWKAHGAKIMQRLSSVDDGYLSGDGSIPQKPSIIDHQGYNDVTSIAYDKAYKEYEAAGRLAGHKQSLRDIQQAQATDTLTQNRERRELRNQAFDTNHRPKIEARQREMLADPKERAEVIKHTLAIHLEKIKPEYHGWVMREYAAGNIKRMEDISSTTADALESYHAIKSKPSVAKKYMVSRDINQFHVAPTKLLHEPYKDGLYELTPEHEHANEEAMKHNIMNLHHTIARVPSHEMLPDLEPHEYTKIDEPHWTIIQPHTQAASCKYGAGTQWCTAARNNNQFDYYNKRGKLSIFIPKNPERPGEKYQMWVDHTSGTPELSPHHDRHREPTMEFNNEEDNSASHTKVGLGMRTTHVYRAPQASEIQFVTPEEAKAVSHYTNLEVSHRPSMHFKQRMESEVFGQGNLQSDDPKEVHQAVSYHPIDAIEHLADHSSEHIRGAVAFHAARVIRDHPTFGPGGEGVKRYYTYIKHTPESHEAAKRVVAKLANDKSLYVRNQLNV